MNTTEEAGPVASDVPGTSAADGVIDVCALDDLVPERGVAALLGGTQIAVYRLTDDSVHAVQQLDPYSGAYVLSRGLVGTHAEQALRGPGTATAPAEDGGDGAPRTVPTLSSPMYKQVWNLDDGSVIDPAGGDDLPLDVYAVRIHEGRVLIDPEPRT